MKRRLRSEDGFTVIELLVVIVVVCILGLFIGLAYSGVRANDRNDERRHDIDKLKRQLEGYSAEAQAYPTLAEMNDATWRAKYLPEVSTGDIQDPRWNDAVADCTASSKPALVKKSIADCYSYQVTSADGSDCDNKTITCAHYTLTAILEGGGTYVKSSLN